MKYIIGLLLVTFLASCTSTNEEPIIIEDDINMQIQEEIDSLWIEEEEEEVSEEEKIVILDANYNNPAGPVDMTIEYSLDEENKIDFIDVRATTYDVTGFNSEVQKLIWKTIEEAWDAELSGWTLTTEAFKEALK